MQVDSRFDYAVIVALDEEASYFVDVVECGEAFSFEGFTARIISQDSWQRSGTGVLISSGDMGKGLAIATAKAAIEKGRVSIIYNVGIAGRVDRELSIGDVVVPTLIYDVTNGSKLASDAAGKTHWKLSPEVLSVPGELATRARIDFAARSVSLRLINERMNLRFGGMSLLSNRGVQVHSRPHACVPAVIAFDDLREDMSKIHRKMATMDMETAGIVQAATGTDVEVLCIRAISDGADQHKKNLELEFADENRRFAMEAAIAVLDRTIELQTNLPEVDPDAIPNPKDGLLFVISSEDAAPDDWASDFQLHEELFSLLIVDKNGDLLVNPITTFVDQLLTEDRSPALLIGEKGAGKTTFLKFLQQGLVAHTSAKQGSPTTIDLAFFLRMSSFEEWEPGNSGQLDAALSIAKLKEACEKIIKQSREKKGCIFVIIDGLNQTGPHRLNMVVLAIRMLRGVPKVRFALSAERMQDVVLLDGAVALNVRSRAELRALPIEDASTTTLVERFAAVVRTPYSPDEVLTDMKEKGVAFVDLFLLGQFFGKFRWLTYDDFRYLSECYHQFCVNELSHVAAVTALHSHQVVSEIAETAFDILISRRQKFADVRRREAALLISNHASVTAYLVAQHVIDTIVTNDNSRSRMNNRLNYVFPAEINKFTKQIMLSDPHIEEQVVARIKREFSGLSTLARSHCAYLAGRVSEARAPEMREFLKRVSLKLTPPKPGQRDLRMLRRSVLISRSMLGDLDAERDYAELLLRDHEESSFNRGFHLEYYGDVQFEPDGKMASGDDKDKPCDRTFARLIDRIHARPEDQPPLIELITLLSLVQFRLFSKTLRRRHRQQTFELLDRSGLRGRVDLPPRIRGYLGRMREDLAAENFDPSTVFDDWIALQNTSRTGWLRRRRDADVISQSFWAEKRIESVAEHVFSAIGLASLFLKDRGDEDEPYSKSGVVEMLIYHDLAEGRLGDKLPQHADAEAEQEVLWEYGAFGTYPGFGHLWRVPQQFLEFTAGLTHNARIAQDIDRLQFIMQARLYREGMSAKEREECEKVAARLTTKTVRGIFQNIAAFPRTPRFNQPDPQF